MAEQLDLAELLMETGHHHHHAYRSSDGIDPEWALWYAGYLQTRLWDTFGDVPSRSRLVHLLLAAEEAFNAGPQDGDWPPFYAEYMARRLS